MATNIAGEEETKSINYVNLIYTKFVIYFLIKIWIWYTIFYIFIFKKLPTFFLFIFII